MFHELFLDYEIRLKEIRSRNQEKLREKMSLEIILLLFSMLVVLASALVALYCQRLYVAYVLVLLSALCAFCVNYWLTGRVESKKIYLDKWRVSSGEIIEMLRGLLCEQGIDSADARTVDLLIEQAKNERSKHDGSRFMERSSKIFGVIVIPSGAYLCKALLDSVPLDVFFIAQIFLLVLGFSMGISIIYAHLLLDINSYIPRYQKYTEFIYNLEQLKIFKENSHSRTCSQVVVETREQLGEDYSISHAPTDDEMVNETTSF